MIEEQKISPHKNANPHLPSLNVMAVQMRIHAGKPEQNTESILSTLKQHRHQTDVLVFPEMAVPGYLIGDVWERDSFIDRCEDCHAAILEETKNITVVFGSVGRDKRFNGEDGRPRLYNAAHVFQDQKATFASHIDLPYWPKTLMANYREFDDSRHFYDLRKWSQEAGLKINDCFQPVKIQCRTDPQVLFYVGITICEDAWDDDYALSPLLQMSTRHRQKTGRNLDLVLNISASPYTKGKETKRHSVFQRRQKEINAPLLYVNTLGAQNNGKNIFVFDGRSAFYNSNESGQSTLQEALPFIETTLQIQINLADFIATQNKTQKNSQSRTETQNTVEVMNTLKIGEEKRSSKPPQGTREFTAALLYGLAETLTDWNIQNVVVGASGGIDSAVSAALFTYLLGAEKVTLINMPSKFNSTSTKNAAKELAENLGTRYFIFPIEDGIEETKKLIFKDPFLSQRLSDHVAQNLQARDRGGRILAAVAAALGGVFSCNANKSELTIGYATLYGDAAGFLAPIGDLWKSEVYALAKELNTIYFKFQAIPQACFELPPSAELSFEHNVNEGRGDPLFYPYHDRLFRIWVEGWKRYDLYETLTLYETGRLHEAIGVPWQMIARLFDTGKAFAEDATKWWNLYTGLAAFKRVQTPPILVLSQRAFGFDHRESVGVFHGDPRLKEKKQSVMNMGCYSPTRETVE